MPAFADIVIKDGAATPVDKTFSVKKTVGTVSVWEERSSGIPVAYTKLQSETKESDTVRRVKLSVSLPVLEAVAGVNAQGYTPAPAVAFMLRGNVEFILPQRCSTQNRKDIAAFVKNALAHATFTSLILDGAEIAG